MLGNNPIGQGAIGQGLGGSPIGQGPSYGGIGQSAPESSYNGMYQDQFVNTADVMVKSIFFVPTKQYKDVYRRPYEMNATPQILNSLETIIGDQIMQGRNVSTMAIANHVPDIMKLSDIPKERVEIANGWGTTRLRFIMEVHSDLNGSLNVSYIQGYTEYHDPSISGKIDPNMKMYINSITNVIRSASPDGRTHARVHSSFNVLYDPFTKGYSVENTTSNHRLLRPKDVVSGIDSAKMFGNQPGLHLDTTSLYGMVPQESKRSNSVGVEHVTAVINSCILGQEMSDIGHDTADLFNAASSTLTETNLAEVPFIEAMSAVTGDVTSVEFTLNQIEFIQPDIGNRLILSDNSMGPVREATFLDTDQTENLNTVSIEATIASTISESVSSLLIDELLSVMHFSITNMSPNSELVVVGVPVVKSFIEGIDESIYAERFLSKFKAIIMPTITKGNLIGVDMFIAADIIGDTVISVSVNSAPPVVYRFPTFSNSLYTSMVSDEGNFNVVVEDFNQMLSMSKII